MTGLGEARTGPAHGVPRIRHVVFGCLLAAMTVSGTAALGSVLAQGGLGAGEAVIVVLFAVLVSWIGAAFLVSAFGAAALWTGQRLAGRKAGPGAPSTVVGREPGSARTAIVMPIYNEEAARVFAGIRAIYRSLEQAGALDAFDVFVLSDSTDPETWLAEEQAWYRACRDLGAQGRLFYRHRNRNSGRKSGNIAEFCVRWGRRYDYMVVLDADSIMSGRTLVHLVDRMDRDPRLALLQTWPRQGNGRTLFARAQQFGASCYGRVMTAGLSFLQLGASNYWGHNAIVRVRAFMENCGLPPLPGRPPFGGEILSHDFVEAALLVRAGWKVELDPALTGSFEEGPPSLLDHAKRDRRWCQGNLQHARLLAARNLHPMSRLNLFMGILTYASAPLWFLFIALSINEAWSWQPFSSTTDSFAVFEALRANPQADAIYGLLAFTASLLFLPKILGLIDVLVEPYRRGGHGGPVGASLSTCLETLFTALIAPIMMVRHCCAIAAVLRGRDNGWGAQRRAANRIRLREAFDAFKLESLVGLTLGAVVVGAAPGLLLWLTPVLLGLLTAVPLCVASASAALGAGLRRFGIFLVPHERWPEPILSRLDRLMSDLRDDRVGRRRETNRLSRVLEDPLANALHRALLRDGSPGIAIVGDRRQALLERVRCCGPGGLDRDDEIAVLRDHDLMCELHVAYWLSCGADSTAAAENARAEPASVPVAPPARPN